MLRKSIKYHIREIEASFEHFIPYWSSDHPERFVTDKYILKVRTKLGLNKERKPDIKRKPTKGS